MNLNNPNPNQELIQLEDIILETASVAMIRQDVAEISKQNNLIFEESFDDLDFLVYATLSFSHSNSRVGLIRRRNSPVSGIEICVRHEEQHQSIVLLVCETLRELSLTAEDLIWIHPNYQEEIYKLVEHVQFVSEIANNKVSESKQFQPYKNRTDLKPIDRLREIRERWGNGTTSNTSSRKPRASLNKQEEELVQDSFSESNDLVNEQRASNHEKR
jgi:hypothetical protein